MYLREKVYLGPEEALLDCCQVAADQLVSCNYHSEKELTWFGLIVANVPLAIARTLGPTIWCGVDIIPKIIVDVRDWASGLGILEIRVDFCCEESILKCTRSGFRWGLLFEWLTHD
jgi:hypothetical protein